MRIRCIFPLCFGLCLLLLAGACGRKGDNGNDNDREVIYTDRAPEAVGPYSQAVRVGNTLYLSGQVGLVPGTGKLAQGGLEPQTRQAMQNIQAVLEAAGFALSDVTEVEVYLTDMEDYGTFNDIYVSWFEDEPPARGVVEVARLPIGALVEIKMTAVRTD